jgi:peroxiredoxin family protein
MAAEMEAQGWVLIIGAVAAGVGYVVKEFAAGWGTRRVSTELHEANQKLDTIHTATNSGMEALKAETKSLQVMYNDAIIKIASLEAEKRLGGRKRQTSHR